MRSKRVARGASLDERAKFLSNLVTKKNEKICGQNVIALRAYKPVYNISSETHQLWVFKTEDTASAMAESLRIFCEAAWNLYNNSQNANLIDIENLDAPKLSLPVSIIRMNTTDLMKYRM